MLKLMGDAMYKHYGGRTPAPEDYCNIHLGPIQEGRVVILHCGHKFCLKHCFPQLLKYDHTKCPVCRTPMVLVSPDVQYIRLVLYTLAKEHPTEEAFIKVDRMNQYRLIHDGDTRPIMMQLHGGVPDDILEQMYQACKVCQFAGKRQKPSAAAAAAAMAAGPDAEFCHPCTEDAEEPAPQEEDGTEEMPPTENLQHAPQEEDRTEEMPPTENLQQPALCTAAPSEDPAWLPHLAELFGEDDRQLTPVMSLGMRVASGAWLRPMLSGVDREDTPEFLPGFQDQSMGLRELDLGDKSYSPVKLSL